MNKSKMLLIGNGNMGSCFINQIHHLFDLTVVDRSKQPQFSCNYLSSVEDLNDKFDTIVFAVKPFDLHKVLKRIDKRFMNDNCRLISLIAGTNSSMFKNFYGEDIKITLCMANLPVKVGKGIIAIYSDERLDYLNNLGQTIYLNKESDIGIIKKHFIMLQINIPVSLVLGQGSVILFLRCTRKAQSL